MVASCAVVIKDAEVCGDMGIDGAQCFHTLTPASRALTLSQWDDIRFGQLCTSADSFANWKDALEKLCHQPGACKYQTEINAFFLKVKNFKKNAKQKPE